MHSPDLDSIFFLPLSSQATEELRQLQMHIQNISYDEDTTDLWQPTWGSEYTSRKFYKHAFDNLDCHPVFKSIWKSKCTNRIKFFAWLLLVDRLNTKTMLTRRHIFVHNDELCVMCNTGAAETINHLFFTCPFARQCWAKININWNLSLNLEDRLLEAKQRSEAEFFTEATLIESWELWKIRNDKIFDRQVASCNSWFCNFK